MYMFHPPLTLPDSLKSTLSFLVSSATCYVCSAELLVYWLTFSDTSSDRERPVRQITVSSSFSFQRSTEELTRCSTVTLADEIVESTDNVAATRTVSEKIMSVCRKAIRWMYLLDLVLATSGNGLMNFKRRRPANWLCSALPHDSWIFAILRIGREFVEQFVNRKSEAVPCTFFSLKEKSEGKLESL